MTTSRSPFRSAPQAAPQTGPSPRLKVLFADDERSLQELMRNELPRMGHQVTVCPDGRAAVAALERDVYDCLLVDLDMPGYSGIEVIERARDRCPGAEAVILTGKSSLESAVAALRQGAFDYLTKPCKLVEIESLLERIAEKRELKHKYRALKRRVERLEGAPRLIGQSEGIERVRDLIAKVAPSGSTVLVLGETGTGKELVARAVHELSPRSEMPFVTVNCGALPETLIESELFGHKKGSFTGADEQRAGLLEVAHGGTLFLDEIGELPKAMQAKLLRVLEGGEIRRVGESKAFHVDVRVVCATHRNLEEMVTSGDFREDLMFRINTFEIYLPPLRDRIDDVPLLAEHLLARFRQGRRAETPLFTAAAISALTGHSWPGNVRELANAVEHATILCGDGPIDRDHLPDRFHAGRPAQSTLVRRSARSLREVELQAICDAIEENDGSKAKAAQQLGISIKTLYNKINQVEPLEKSA